ncbi:hypothetical protein [Streptomyces cucumeris]|uniref:hypothetical protein n=1 Tax=Streptomyces cucumeris TaxID=2962890 RepID=UPI0020C91515|nr:hypothetical protein [Streptomyces sp. NEAU-Y11]MCP9205556.1 hypothetical protein [Streptomyces sp. NEAU-Y11]
MATKPIPQKRDIAALDVPLDALIETLRTSQPGAVLAEQRHQFLDIDPDLRRDDYTHPAQIGGAPKTDLFQSADGKRWRLAGTDASGARLFVPAQCDPAKVKRWVWAKEAELVATVGVLSPVVAA